MRQNETNVTLDTTDIDIRQNNQGVATMWRDSRPSPLASPELIQ